MKQYFLLVLMMMSSLTILWTQAASIAGKTKEELREMLTSNQLEVSLHVDVLLELSYLLRGKQPEVALKYAEEALSLAREINYEGGIADAHMRLGFFASKAGEYDEALVHYQKTLTYRLLLDSLQSAASAYNSIGTTYKKKEKREKLFVISTKDFYY